MKEKNLWMGLAIASLALFMIPYTVSMFAGQHTFYNVCDMESKCSKCHEDVWNQLDGSQTVEAHKNAANNNNYTTYMGVGGIEYDKTAHENYNSIYSYYPVTYTMDFVDDTIGDNQTYDNGDVAYFWNSSRWEKTIWDGSSFISTGEFKLIRLDTNNDGSIDTNELCSFCHNTTLFGLSGTHTRRTVRVCDDDRCHGNQNRTYNDPDLFGEDSGAAHVGVNLSRSVHAAFYLSASNESSPHVAGEPFGHGAGNVHGSYISKGYWSCMGCHSGAGANITFGQAEHYGHGDESAPTRYR